MNTQYTFSSLEDVALPNRSTVQEKKLPLEWIPSVLRREVKTRK